MNMQLLLQADICYLADHEAEINVSLVVKQTFLFPIYDNVFACKLHICEIASLINFLMGACCYWWSGDPVEDGAISVSDFFGEIFSIASAQHSE